MGVLNHNTDTDFIPYIKDEYNVSVHINNQYLYPEALKGSQYDRNTLPKHLEDEISRIRCYNDDHMMEQIKIVSRIILAQYFTHKHSNGLYKKFTFEHTKTEYTGRICYLRDDLRNTHLTITLKPKRYGFIQKTTKTFSRMVKFIRR